MKLLALVYLSGMVAGSGWRCGRSADRVQRVSCRKEPRDCIDCSRMKNKVSLYFHLRLYLKFFQCGLNWFKKSNCASICSVCQHKQIHRNLAMGAWGAGVCMDCKAEIKLLTGGCPDDRKFWTQCRKACLKDAALSERLYWESVSSTTAHGLGGFRGCKGRK